MFPSLHHFANGGRRALHELIVLIDTFPELLCLLRNRCLILLPPPAPGVVVEARDLTEPPPVDRDSSRPGVKWGVFKQPELDSSAADEEPAVLAVATAGVKGTAQLLLLLPAPIRLAALWKGPRALGGSVLPALLFLAFCSLSRSKGRSLKSRLYKFFARTLVRMFIVF